MKSNIYIYNSGSECLVQKNKKNIPLKTRGNAFIREATGSATKINLDGKWEHDFTDHEEKKAGE